MFSSAVNYKYSASVPAYKDNIRKFPKFGANEEKTPACELTEFVLNKIEDIEKEQGFKPVEHKYNIPPQITYLQAKEVIGQRLEGFSHQIEANLGEWKQMASIDILTKLNTNALYNIERKKLVIDACIKNKPLGIICCDLNKFKPINDKYGHDAGNRVLQCTGKIFNDSIMGKGKSYRTGGDEFVVLIPDGDYEKTMQIAEKLKENIKEKTIQDKKNKIIPESVTGSIGYAVFNPSLITNADKITEEPKIMSIAMEEFQKRFNLADAACYKAKKCQGEKVIGEQELNLEEIDKFLASKSPF